MKVFICSFSFCCILNISCSNELDVLSDLKSEAVNSYDISSITVSNGTFAISYLGGTTHISDIPVKCKVTTPHSHSSYNYCEATVFSGYFGWYSISMQGYTEAIVTVFENKTSTPRTTRIGNTALYQPGRPESSNINWNEVKSQYSISGPRWTAADGIGSFNLIGPYLSSSDIKIYWTISPYNNIGGGTITTGQGTTCITAAFYKPDCGGIVRARVEPVKSPQNGFILEFVVSVN